MISEKVAKLLNEQINKELFSAYLYLDMANYYDDEQLEGFENWFYIQAQEERDHAMLMRSYMLANDLPITLSAVEGPNQSYKAFDAPLHVTLAHEEEVTASINSIYAAAYEEKDFRTMQFLDWFVKEQMEEEKNARDMIKKYDLYGGDAKGLYLLDQEFGARVYAAPTLVVTD